MFLVPLNWLVLGCMSCLKWFFALHFVMSLSLYFLFCIWGFGTVALMGNKSCYSTSLNFPPGHLKANMGKVFPPLSNLNFKGRFIFHIEVDIVDCLSEWSGEEILREPFLRTPVDKPFQLSLFSLLKYIASLLHSPHTCGQAPISFTFHPFWNI